ncbi:MAG: NTP transferase domain-containing protein [Gammaproteobacteria bacterium]|nr:NTP transferase domain-containing protein [Gammaproteobacteria bacterium]
MLRAGPGHGAVRSSRTASVVVHGHGGERGPAALPMQRRCTGVQQDQQLGTGDALRAALPELGDAARVLVLYGDVPLLSAATLERLLQPAGGRPRPC